MKFDKTYALQSFTLTPLFLMFKINRNSYETSSEAVDRAFKQAKLNDKDVILTIFGEEHLIPQDSTNDEIIRLKHLLRIKSDLQKLKDKGLVVPIA
jgi:hypothetical protein